MAASESRRLRRIIKEYVRRVEIANPEIKQTRANVIKEFFADDRTKDDPNFEPAYPWKGGSNVKRENTLKNLRAKPFKNGINPHGYQLDVYVYAVNANGVRTKTAKQDRLWFYDNGTVWSTNQIKNLYYRAADTDTIDIYTDESARNSANKENYYAGYINLEGTRAVYNILSTDTKEKELSTWDKTEDIIHTILDWVGFVPGIGDAVDVVNGVWYLIDAITEDDPWLYLEAFLSFIAVIPIVGSAMKAGLKAAISGISGLPKLLKASMKAKDAKASYELWSKILQKGTFTPSQLEALGNGLDEIGKMFKKTKGWLPDDIYKALDDFADWSAQSADDIANLSKTTAGMAAKQASSFGALNKTVSGVADTATAGVELVAKVVPISTQKITGLFKRFRRTGILPEDKILKVAKGMELKFMDELANAPAKLTVLLKQTPNPESLIDTFKGIDDAKDIVKKYFETAVTKTYRDGPKMGQTYSEIVTKNLKDVSPRELGKMFSELEQAGPKVWTAVKRETGEFAIKNESWLWNTYRTNSINELNTVLSKRYMGGEGIRGLIPNKSDVKSFRKWVDIVYNELQDAGEDITKEQIADNPTGVIYPMLKYGLNKALPGTSQSISDMRDKAVQNPVAKAGMAMLGVGVTKDGELKQQKNIDYDPFGEAGGKFK